ncbi:MAG: hypothetical protein CYG60_22595 [Actinobacteria bacterium]|nr:MAG: hypothetical protein CYG60_22595 [Actinomycetota bacterium]
MRSWDRRSLFLPSEPSRRRAASPSPVRLLAPNDPSSKLHPETARRGVKDTTYPPAASPTPSTGKKKAVGYYRGAVLEKQERAGVWCTQEWRFSSRSSSPCTLALYLIERPFALLLGILTDLLCFIPLLGPVFSVFLPLLLPLASGEPVKALWVVAAYVVIQSIEGNVIEPVVMSWATALHPVVIVFALLIVVTLFGFVGLLLAVPSVAALHVLLRKLWTEKLDEEGIDPEASRERRAGAVPQAGDRPTAASLGNPAPSPVSSLPSRKSVKTPPRRKSSSSRIARCNGSVVSRPASANSSSARAPRLRAASLISACTMSLASRES